MGMKFKLEIDLGNDRMMTCEDVSAALHAVASSLVDDWDSARDSGKVRDVNGNVVGTWSATWPQVAS